MARQETARHRGRIAPMAICYGMNIPHLFIGKARIGAIDGKRASMRCVFRGIALGGKRGMVRTQISRRKGALRSAVQ